MNTSLDLVVLVDHNDTELGVMDKYEAHRNPAKLHRAISVFLFNDTGKLLIQQRSTQKIVGALQWANTCCGNVWPDESYEACAYRRLQYELGITDAEIQPVYKFQYSVKCNEEFGENEIDQVFIGRYSGTVLPNPDEVAQYSWVDFADVQQYKLAPWFQIMLDDQKLRESLK